MFAVIVNSLAIIVGTFIGLVFKKLINKEITQSILKVLGVVVIITGLIGVFKSIIIIEEGIIQSQLDLFLLIVVVVGIFIGEILKIDDRLHNFGKFIDNKIKFGKVSEGFINASIIFVVGAMSIVGSINAGLGDNSILYLKSALDGVTAIILATTLGIGVGFAFLPVLLFQGTIYLLTFYLGNFMALEFINAFNLIGYFIVTCIGLNFLLKEKIKIANLLPSLILVVIYFLLK